MLMRHQDNLQMKLGYFSRFQPCLRQKKQVRQRITSWKGGFKNRIHHSAATRPLHFQGSLKFFLPFLCRICNGRPCTKIPCTLVMAFVFP